MRTFITTLAATTALAIAMPALAQDAQSDLADGWSVSANVAFTTDYRWRGVSFSDGDFAVQGGFDIGHENGFS